MSWIKDLVKNWLNIQEPQPMSVTIQEPYSYEATVYRNQLWYRGDPSELHQFYTQTDDYMYNTEFWAACSTTGINFRKIHTGIPALIVDMLVNIIVSDMLSIEIASTEAQKRWDEIAEDNDFSGLLKDAIRNTLVEGDGAFKISYDPEISEWPIIEFYSGERVRYKYNRGRLEGICFITKYCYGKKVYLLEESYTPEGVTYVLYDPSGLSVDLSTVPELADLQPVAGNDFMMAEQLLFDRSMKWDGRGKSIYEGKSGAFDALDETISQWVESMRDCRTTRYIPETLIPKDAETGRVLRPNSFDNRYIQSGADLAEDAKNQIQLVSGNIPDQSLVNTYITLLDMAIQGIISPSTLGIDVKKLDNAEAQREKEKATLYTRNKLIDKLQHVIPDLVETVLKTDDKLKNRAAGEYDVSIEFGEYANPSFEAQVETLGKAKASGIMSIERIVDELYGDTLDEEEKAAEVMRLKNEQGVIELPDPGAGTEMEMVREPPPDSGGAISSAEGVVGKSLNGAQTQSLIAVIGQYSAGSITEGQAINVISVAIGVSKEEAAKIIQGAL